MKRLIIVIPSVALALFELVTHYPLSTVNHNNTAPVGKYHESKRSQILVGSTPSNQSSTQESVVKMPAAKKPLAQKPIAELPWFGRPTSEKTNKEILKAPRSNSSLGKYHELNRSEILVVSTPSNLEGVHEKSVIDNSGAKMPLAQNLIAELPCFENSTTQEKNEEIPDTRRPNPYPIPKRIDLGHIEGKGVGYDTGYTKLSVILGPEYRVGHHSTLLDLRGVVFDDGKFAANAGFIGRFLSKSFCEIFGWNIFYDFRQGKRRNFNQVSGGFEVLNKRWELHANASVPVGKRKRTKTCVYDNYVGPYREVCKSTQAAAYVFDGNLGYYLVNGKNFQLYAAAGSYYLTGPLHTSAVGGKAWLRTQFGDILSVELSASHDRVFHTIYQVNAVLTLPLYKLSPVLKKKRGPCGMSTRQVYQPIDRDMVLYKKCCCHDNF